MAPWSSWWSQSASQQSNEEQQKLSPPSPPPKTNSPSPLSQTPALPSTELPRSQIKSHGYRERPTPAELWEIGAKSLQTGMVTGQLPL